MSHQEPERVEQGPSKKLRSMDTDLCVVVGEGDDKKEYHYHSALLAAQSTYIDTMLSTPMKESQDKVIYFPDLAPSKWESMLKFLGPMTSRTMTRAEAEKLASAYDRYDFDLGRQFCSSVFSHVFEDARIAGKTFVKEKPDDLDGLIDLYVLSHDTHLSTAVVAGSKFFKAGLTSSGQFGRLVFTEAHMKKIQPLVNEYNLLPEWSTEKVSSTSFPKDFVQNAFHTQYESTMETLIKSMYRQVNLRGAGDDLDGTYWRGRFIFTSNFSSGQKIVGIIGDDWAIYREISRDSVRRIFWKCPNSSSCKVLPPKFGWIPVDSSVHGEVEIKYLLWKDKSKSDE